jgi:hypothetical protein
MTKPEVQVQVFPRRRCLMSQPPGPAEPRMELKALTPVVTPVSRFLQAP